MYLVSLDPASAYPRFGCNTACSLPIVKMSILVTKVGESILRPESADVPPYQCHQQVLPFFLPCCIDFPAYSDTGYSDNLLTLTVFAILTFLESVTVCEYLLTVTLSSCPEGVTVSGDVCSREEDATTAIRHPNAVW